MKTMITTLALMFLAAACSNDNGVDEPIELDDNINESKEYELVWSDEFDKDGMVNEYYWGYDEGYCRNNELQDYKKADPKYARVEMGN